MFDYTAIADRLRMVSWSNYSQPNGVVNWFAGPTIPVSHQPCNPNDATNEM